MVKKTFLKECFRAIRGSLSRFMAIFAIVALGSGFLAGLLATTPDMRYSVSQLYHQTNLYDLRIAGNLGLEEGDVAALAAVPGVRAVMPARSVDRELLLSSGDELVGRFHGVTDWEGDDPSVINRTVLQEGRWPQSPDECVVEVSSELYQGALGIGATLELLPLEPDEDGEEPEDPFTVQELTIVGTVTSGYYVSMVQRGSTTLGTGSLGCIVYVQDALLDMDYYTDIYAVVEGGQAAEAFTQEYEDLVAPIQLAVEDMAETQKHVRADRLRGDAQEELDEAKQELADKTAEGEQELADALRDLQDGEQEYADGLKDLEEARQELADGEKDYEEGLQTFLDGKQEYEDGLKDYAEGVKEYEDGLKELEDAYQELLDGEKELEEARIELEDGEKEYADGLKELEDAQKEIDDGQKELDDAYRSIQDAKRELKQALSRLEDSEAELESGRRQLDAAMAELEAGQAQLEAGRQQLRQQQAALDQAHRDGLISDEAYEAGLQEIGASSSYLDQQQDALDAGLKEIQSGMNQLDRGADQLASGWAEYEAALEEVEDADIQRRWGLVELDLAREELEKGRQELADARAELDDGWKEYEEGKQELADAWQEYEDGRRELEEGWLELEDARLELEDARIEMEDGEQELIDARKELDDGYRELLDGEKELADARIELDDGWAEYEDGKLEFEEKIADANMKIRDAQDQIDDIDDPEWYVLTRGESNEGYIFYESDTEKVSAIAKVFPIFFFLVAALVASTTMTRMIDEDRGNIGTLKALGYSNAAIAGKYLFYAALACLLGAAVGLAIFLPLFPRVIAQAYALMYQLPAMQASDHTMFILLSAGGILCAVLLATLGALKGSLQDNAAVLMRPKAPPAGKRILLERIRPLWKRMKFTHKVTARNLFRYKKRFFMTVIGIAGCTSLLVAGFGLRDSIGDIVTVQFTELQQYDLTLAMEHEGDDTADRLIRRVLLDKTQVTDYLPVHMESGAGISPGRETDLNIVVPSDITAFTDYHIFRDRISGEPVPFTGEGAILTEKAAKVLGLSAGDSMTLRNQDDEQAAIPVAGICENYVQGYVFLPEDIYEQAFHEECAFDTILAKTTAADQAARDDMAAALLNSNNATGVSFSTTTIETFADMLGSIDYIVILLIVAAAALAFVVLYNLTNINICERQKEIATLKVLGFYRREVSKYVFRETILLSIIGTAVGLAVGVVFHQFVVQTAEVDAVMFGRVVQPLSYVYSAALSLVFTFLVSLFMRKKLHRIDMVESLKAPE